MSGTKSIHIYDFQFLLLGAILIYWKIIFILSYVHVISYAKFNSEKNSF